MTDCVFKDGGATPCGDRDSYAPPRPNQPAFCRRNAGGGGAFLEGKADHSPTPSAKVKNAWSFISTPHIHLHVVMLRYRGKFCLLQE
jgi:hypothetical protein